MSDGKYFESHDMQMRFKRAIYHAMGIPMPEPAPEPAPEPVAPPTPEPPAAPIDEAEAEYQALIAKIAKFRYIRHWHISRTDRNLIEARIGVPIDNAKSPTYTVEVVWSMTLAEFIEYQTPIEAYQAWHDRAWHEKEWVDVPEQRRPSLPKNTPRPATPNTPIPLDHIRQELDKQGYDFIPGAFLAVKRTGVWG